ncbi:unnamed protein product [Pleuronectes platessa]|uniref:Uncharacterized protein n=1 Tax=Pleuronectes platessa TaxID=8262 RepID=A0A9N7UW46_PLEPL|nr:unnamed protein product [Pleuronectes platessa]
MPRREEGEGHWETGGGERLPVLLPSPRLALSLFVCRAKCILIGNKRMLRLQGGRLCRRNEDEEGERQEEEVQREMELFLSSWFSASLSDTLLNPSSYFITSTREDP